MRRDSYEEAERERKSQEAAVVRELDQVARRWGARAWWAPTKSRIYVTARPASVTVRWCLSLAGAPHIETTPGRTVDLAGALKIIAQVLSDLRFEAALGDALDRLKPEVAAAKRAAELASRPTTNRYRGD